MEKNDSRGAHWALNVLLGLLFILSLAWLSYGNYQAGSKPWEIAVSALLLAVPLALLFFSIGVFIVAAQQRKRAGRINPRLAAFIYWTPRIAGILIILFVAMFALDVFSEGGNILGMLGAFVLHALPAILMGIVLAIAWKRDWVGFVLFLAGAIFFLRVIIRNPLDNLGTVLLFSGPMLMIALLFWANWKWKKELLPTQPSGA